MKNEKSSCVFIPATGGPPKITGITLLSVEEYLEAKDIVPRLDSWWWLRSLPCNYWIWPSGCHVAYVCPDGNVSKEGEVVDRTGAVRPALRIDPESHNLIIGDKFQAAGHTWTVIQSGLALCNSSIGECCFREDWRPWRANNYRASYIKKFIEDWAYETGLLPMRKIDASGITGITLLSKKEYEEAKDVVPLPGDIWWLRSPGDNIACAASVDGDFGEAQEDGFYVEKGLGVRPALRIDPESHNLIIGDKFQAAGHTWTVIQNGLALCDGFIGKHCFREDCNAPDANVYEASDIKQFIERWAQENGLLPREICVRDVTGITLLSVEEYGEAKDIVPFLKGWWWLRSPGCFSFNSARVHVVGSVNGNGIIVDEGAVSVRPALRLNPETCHLSIGDRFLAAGHTWTVIPGGLALCDEFIGMHCFREDWEAPDANVYETSDIKQFIEKWARENGLPT